MDAQSRVTGLLIEYRDGDAGALDRLFPLLCDELHRIAHRQMLGERPGHTLCTSALVNEAYLRLVDITRVQWQDRAHFLAMASTAMRRVLIDHARRFRAQRRGGGRRAVSLDEADIAVEEQADTLLALDEAVEELAELNPRLARVVECRFFAGLTEEETGEALDMTSRTVRRDWVKARAWLKERLRDKVETGEEEKPQGPLLR